MTKETPKSYHNSIIYEVFVRNHGPNGTFADVEKDLVRIRNLGVDIVWLMPIYPIGEKNRKGKLGCPYSISDYRRINPEYGNLDDFRHLIKKAHNLGLKVIIDIVFNHTAHDSFLVNKHPNWFVQDKNHNPISTIPNWSDVVNLKHSVPGLRSYLIETLIYWVQNGVDGFRCDIASFLPLGFWIDARETIGQIKPHTIWLAESVHAEDIPKRRENGLPGVSDSELYQAFDFTYDYDIWPVWQATILGKIPTSRLIEMLRFQECIYPANYIKLRFMENHDQKRIVQFAPSKKQALAWTAFSCFIEGAFLIYAGQESACAHTPSLFEKDKINWHNYELTQFFKRLFNIKKDLAISIGKLIWLSDKPVIQAAWYDLENSLYGIFNTSKIEGYVRVNVPDGNYFDSLNNNDIIVREGKLKIPESASIFHYQPHGKPCSISSVLF